MSKPFGLLSLAALGALLAQAQTVPDLPQECMDGIMTTPTYGLDNAIFTVCSSIIISASPQAIYDVLLDFPSYPLWNSFVYDVEDEPANVTSPADVYVNMPMTFLTAGLIPGVNTTSNEIISWLEPAAEPSAFMAWKDDSGVGTLLEAEHVSMLVVVAPGQTKYVSWETYYGAGAVAVLTLEGNLNKEFTQQGVDLNNRMAELADS